MPKFHKALSLAAALAVAAFAAPAIAQETDQPSELSMGQEVAAGAPQVYNLETNGDWEVRCFKVEGAEQDPCEMYQLLKDDKENPTAEISLFKLVDGGQAEAGATVTVPLETLLTSQLMIAVDGAKPKRYPFSFCNPVGCFARIGLTGQDVETYRKGSSATVTIVPAAAPDQQVNLPLSLSGFTKSYEKVATVTN